MTLTTSELGAIAVPGSEAFLEFQLVGARGWSSRWIEYFDASTFSHVDIVWPDGQLFGARSDCIDCLDPTTRQPVTVPPGVQFRPPGYAQWVKVIRIAVPCTLEEKFRGLDWALAQRGKRYDKLAILGFAVGRDWRDDDAWFCSELATRYLEVALGFRLPITPNKITPGTFGCIAGARPGARLRALPIPQLATA